MWLLFMRNPTQKRLQVVSRRMHKRLGRGASDVGVAEYRCADWSRTAQATSYDTIGQMNQALNNIVNGCTGCAGDP